jgi:hypothetical protein
LQQLRGGIRVGGGLLRVPGLSRAPEADHGQLPPAQTAYGLLFSLEIFKPCVRQRVADVNQASGPKRLAQ